MSADPTAGSPAETAEEYRHWARVDSHGSSPVYSRLALAVAGDRPTLELLQRVGRPRRQPNLLLGALRWYGADVEDPDAALAWIAAHPAQVLEVLRTRRTQTNEAARCALLLPVLAQLAARSPGPLALVEVGASAGLCLLYDQWRYRYTTGGASDHPTEGADQDAGERTGERTGERVVGAGDGAVTVTCAVSGPAPVPDAVPRITWRAGLDLHPVDPSDAQERRWLRCLVWPEHLERAERLGAALDVAARVRPDVRAGDMTTDLAALLDEARASAQALAPGSGPATVVVTHTAALVYLSAGARREVREVIARAGAHRLGGEHAGVLPDVDAAVPDAASIAGHLVVSLDDVPLALAHPHGASLHWL